MITFCKFLELKKSKLFELVAKYHKNPHNFSIQYDRRTINRKIVLGIEKNIVRKLKIGKDLIENKEIPTKYYNYI